MQNEQPLSALAQQGHELYDDKLKTLLEPELNGKAVAIHVESGDYVVADSHSEAARLLLRNHTLDGRIVILTIGPPTDADQRLAYRIMAGQKR